MSLLSAAFREKVAKLKDYNMKQEAQEDVGYPTGFPTLDFANGYINTEFDAATGEKRDYFSLGLTDGSYAVFVGRSACGKSTIVEQIAANIVRPFKTSTIFVDIGEAGMTHARRMSLNFFDKEGYKNRYVIRNTGITMENFYRRIKMIHDLKTEKPEDYLYDTGHTDMYGNPIMKLEPTVYILDSIAVLMPERYTDEDEIAGNMAATAAARVIANIFRTILPMLKSANIILLAVNHILEQVSADGRPRKGQLMFLKQGETLPKGRTITYLANNIFRMDDASKMKEDEGYNINGALVDLSLSKSRSSSEKKSIRLVLDFDRGFDPWLSMFEFMKLNGYLYGAGAYQSFDEERTYKFSQKQFKELIYSDPEFARKFYNKVIEYLKQIPYKKDNKKEELAKELNDILISPV